MLEYAASASSLAYANTCNNGPWSIHATKVVRAKSHPEVTPAPHGPIHVPTQHAEIASMLPSRTVKPARGLVVPTHVAATAAGDLVCNMSTRMSPSCAAKSARG